MEVLKASVFHGLATFSGTEAKKPFVGLQRLVEVSIYYDNTIDTNISLNERDFINSRFSF